MKKFFKAVKEISVIPNMVNDIFSYEKENRYNEFTFLNVGNLIPLKRQIVLLKAFTKS